MYYIQNFQNTQEELLDIFNNAHSFTELPIWLTEWIYQYLHLSAQEAKESEEKLLEAKAHFAAKKRFLTLWDLNTVENQEFATGVVDYLQRGLKEKHLYYGLSRKRKKFLSSCEELWESQQWPVDYLLKKAFIDKQSSYA